MYRVAQLEKLGFACTVLMKSASRALNADLSVCIKSGEFFRLKAEYVQYACTVMTIFTSSASIFTDDNICVIHSTYFLAYTQKTKYTLGLCNVAVLLLLPGYTMLFIQTER